MRKILIACTIAMAFAAADAKTPAAPKEPPAAAITHAGDICKATGGFGRVFARGYGHIDAVASDDWAPFEKLTIEAGSITAEASFRGASDTLEGDVGRAEKFLKSLDKAVTAKAKFPHRETSGHAMRFSSGKQAGVTLELHQEEDHIVAVCSGG